MNVTIEEKVFVAAAPERVFDYTQDWSRRAEWDPAVVGADAIAGEERAYRVRGAGGLDLDARYKTWRRPEVTSVALTNTSSSIVVGGGGSWRYEPAPGGTRWTQTNTLVLGRFTFLAPLLRLQLAFATRWAMRRAKARLERPA